MQRNNISLRGQFVLLCLEHGSKGDLECSTYIVSVHAKALNENWNVLEFAFLKVGRCYPRSVGSTTIGTYDEACFICLLYLAGFIRAYIAAGCQQHHQHLAFRK